MRISIKSALTIACFIVSSYAYAMAYPASEVASKYIKIKHPIVTAFPEDTSHAVLSMQIKNTGKQSHTLVGAVTPYAQITKLSQNGAALPPAANVTYNSITLRPQSQVQFAPQGNHIALAKLSAPLSSGDHIPVTLIFADGSHVKVNALALITHKEA